jgi:type IV secretion system protein TrbL
MPTDVSDMPAWARRLRAEQRTRDLHRGVLEAVKDGDRPGAAANPDIEQKEI